MEKVIPVLEVLAVDDAPVNLQILSALLTPLELKITCVDDGEKALELMEHTSFDLLLFDIMLPGIDGLELCRRAKNDPHHRDVPVLILTGVSDRDILLRAFEAGAADFLAKPFHGPELVYRVKAQLRLRNLQKSMENLVNELNLQILKALHTEQDLLKSQTALAEANRALAEWAHKDTLTGLWNRRKAWDLMEYEAERSARQGRIIGLASMDLDHFKSVNDALGHDIGDEVLKKTAGVLANTLRKGDILARWGGEEFLVIFPETELAGALTAAEKMRAAIENAPWDLPDGRRVTISVGVTAKTAQTSWETALKNVDEALYRAKEKGRNRIEGPTAI